MKGPRVSDPWLYSQTLFVKTSYCTFFNAETKFGSFFHFGCGPVGTISLLLGCDFILCLDIGGNHGFQENLDATREETRG